MAQPANSANPNATQERDAARRRSVGILPIAAGLLAVVLGASAIVYYQDKGSDENSASSVSPPLKSDKAASAPAEITQPAASETASTPSASTERTSEANATAKGSEARIAAADTNVAGQPMPRVQAKPAKRHIATASKPAHPAMVEPRDRRVALGAAPHPQYPAQALRAHEQGTVLVLAQVNVDGQVTDARVVGRSGSATLDRAAPEEVRHWKFVPAIHNGRPVVASVEVPVNYRLNQ